MRTNNRLARRYIAARLVSALALVAGLTLALPSATASAASASACAANPSTANCDGALPGAGCTSGSYYVVQSMPLIDAATGNANWNYGYVQLWWSQNCQANWSRVVVNEHGSWFIAAGVQFSNGYRQAQPYNGSAGVYVSPMIYSPSTSTCGNGTVWSGNTLVYYASASQYQVKPGSC